MSNAAMGDVKGLESAGKHFLNIVLSPSLRTLIDKARGGSTQLRRAEAAM